MSGNSLVRTPLEASFYKALDIVPAYFLFLIDMIRSGFRHLVEWSSVHASGYGPGFESAFMDNIIEDH